MKKKVVKFLLKFGNVSKIMTKGEKISLKALFLSPRAQIIKVPRNALKLATNLVEQSKYGWQS